MPILYILCGPSGCGKTTWAENFIREHKEDDIRYVSRDEIRFELVDPNESYFSHEKEVFRRFANTIRQTLVDGFDVIADATHLNWGSRRKLIQAIKQYAFMENVQIIPVVVTASLKTILARNQLRNGRERVPEDVIRRMLGRMCDPELDPYKYTAIMRVTNE
jgi:predicted kinase